MPGYVASWCEGNTCDHVFNLIGSLIRFDSFCIEAHGVPGLRVTRSQVYRQASRHATWSRRNAAPPAGIAEFR